MVYDEFQRRFVEKIDPQFLIGRTCVTSCESNIKYKYPNHKGILNDPIQWIEVWDPPVSRSDLFDLADPEVFNRIYAWLEDGSRLAKLSYELNQRPTAPC